MQIEDITKEALKGLNRTELYDLRFRFIQFYEKHFRGNRIQKVGEFGRKDFTAKYKLLKEEMKARTVGLKPTSLDRALFKHALMGINVADLDEIVVVQDFASIVGQYVKSPMNAENIDMVLKRGCGIELEEKLEKAFQEETGKSVIIDYNKEGPEATFIPVFDLVLRPKDDTKRVVAKKAKKTLAKKKAEKEEEEFRKKLSPAQRKECDEETAKIKENKEKKEAKEPHEFRAAKFTHPNGHPRCLICGDEERIGGVCNMPEAWYEKHEWDDEDAWAEERKKLKEDKTIKFDISKPEETETSIRIPVNPDCEVTATIDVDKDQGITALYCGKIKKIRTYIFSKDKGWTMATAKKWIKDNKGKQAQDEEWVCECLECGHTLKTKEHCIDLKCPKCGGKMRRKERPGIGKSLAFKIIKTDKKQQIVGGIVYEPDSVDAQGDYADSETIQRAMYRFMEKYATDPARVKIMHKGKAHTFPVVECFQPEQDMRVGKQTVKAGSWWMMIKIKSNEIWKQVEAGKLTGLSMGGRASS